MSCFLLSKRLPACLLLLCLSYYLAPAQKQNYSHTYHAPFTKGSVKDFITVFNESGNIIIEYSSNSIDTGKTVSLSNSTLTVGAFLQQVLKGQRISVVANKNKIILVPSSNILPEDEFVDYYSVYGLIKEENSNEPLYEATIWEPLTKKGAVTDAHGYYTLLLPKGKHALFISYVGYKEQKLETNVTNNIRLDVRLSINNAIEEVKVSNDAQTPGENIKVKADKALYDNILGEPDALRSLYLLPGVQNIPDITNGLIVRGGSPDQNLFYQDGIPIFNPTHMLGMVSIVNKTSLKSMEFYKNNFPARFGGGLSSVLDVFTKDGNMKKWKGEANAGLLAGSFTIEGPLKEDRTAIMVAFRNSWINPFLHLANVPLGINFYDLHFKCTQLLGTKDKLMFNLYTGHDKLNLYRDNNNNQQQWGNKAASLTWNRIIGPRAFISTAFNITDYTNVAGFRYALYDNTGNNVQQRVYNTFSSFREYSGGAKFKFSLNNVVRFNTGTSFSYTRIKPFGTNVSTEFTDNLDDFNSIPSLPYNQIALFAESEARLSSGLFLRSGFHISHFKFNDFNHTSVQPRFYTAYRLNEHQQITLSYSFMTQYRHQVTNPYLGINNDFWVPSTTILKPEESHMINIGYIYEDSRKLWFTAEAYYQALNHVTNYAEGKNLFLNNNEWESDIQAGKGWGYGIETNARKTWEHWEVRAAYTLAWNWRKFSKLNNGNRFPFKYDRRHYLNLAATFKPGAKWIFSALSTFATGDVFSLPGWVYPDFDNAQQINDPYSPREYRLIYHSSSANQYRALPYYRMDASAAWHFNLKKTSPVVLTMGVYKIYGSPNQYMYDLEGTVGKRSLVVTTKYNIFKTTPYISCTMSF